jgi:acyl carrier protein
MNPEKHSRIVANRGRVEQRVLELVIEHSRIEWANLNSHLSDELGLDSMDMYDLFMDLEDNFEVSIVDDHRDTCSTPQQIADLIGRLAREAQPAPAPESPPATPGAKWAASGEPDPHGTRYDCERAALAMGHLTDDELANGAFLNYDQKLDIQAALQRKPGYHPPIAWMEAVKDRIRWLSRALARATAPIDMVLYCPACGKQHIDAPEPSMMAMDAAMFGGDWPDRWTNPPHRSHLCHGCKHVWRPADVATNGVAAVKTVGKADSAIDPAAPRKDTIKLLGRFATWVGHNIGHATYEQLRQTQEWRDVSVALADAAGVPHKIEAAQSEQFRG